MRKGAFFFGSVAMVSVLVAACGSDERSGFEGSSSATDTDGGSGFGGGPQFTPDGRPCSGGLDCKVVDCQKQGKGKTTLTGKVYDPAGANPLYNVIVYIPGSSDPEKLPPLKDSTKEPGGITCETCASVVVNPVRSALTDGSGAFTLDDVPVDKNLPIVVQIGKWRRLLHVDTSKECAENAVADHALRLPRNGQEGDLPQMAVTSGMADAFECFLRGIGIDDREFVNGHDAGGHVHMFKGSGGGMGADVNELWLDAAKLKKYDLVLLSCEGKEHNENKEIPGSLFPFRLAQPKHGEMRNYLNAGGKVFATHYHYTWFKNSPEADFKGLASWEVGDTTGTLASYDINQNFPRGAKFAEWLKNVGVSQAQGKIDLEGVTNSVTSTTPALTTWIQGGDKKVKYFSFNTPLGTAADKQCGRAVFSDVHSAADDGATTSSSPKAIGFCPITAGNLNNKQKAIEFLFFDLSACVSDERQPPPQPR